MERDTNDVGLIRCVNKVFLLVIPLYSRRNNWNFRD